MTETITVPLSDYVQRADDEGRDYHAYRTVAAAAEQWAEQDGRGWSDHGPDEDRLLIFVSNGDPAPDLTTVSPDADMEGLYPAADLPFTIKPGEPFAVGDYIKRPGNPTGALFHITAVTDEGYDAVYVGGPFHDATASISLDSGSAFEKVDNPKIEYVVTVSALWNPDDITRAMVASGVVGVTRVNR